MAIYIYNTLARQKEEFLPGEPGRVSMYVCGVTPYAPAHIGHGRSAVAFDVVRRWLMRRGHQVSYVYNLTDIEDKIFAASQREQRDWKELAEGYTEQYLTEMQALAVLPPTHMPRASEHIPEIVALVQRLVESGHAYAIGGDVAFHVPSFPEYGRLSRRDLDQQVVGARVEEDMRKRDPRDFFLWKAAKPGEPSWQSPWGMGRPGWHIECSAMSVKYLGDEFDIHGGGTDLIFPHHENEIAQSEAGTGRPLARYWMHNGMVNVVAGEASGDTEKMAKSLGNITALGETISRVGGPALRYYCVAAHYRSDVTFDASSLEQAAAALERLRIGRQTLDRLVQSAPVKLKGVGLAELQDTVARAQAEFEEAMDDDFSTPRALAALHGLVSTVNRLGASAGADFSVSDRGRQTLVQAKETLVSLASALGLVLEAGPVAHGLAEDLIRLLIDVRQQAREAGQYAIADAVRARLGALGITLEDRPEGTTWRRG